MPNMTPFAKWRENGEKDPHGDHYEGDGTRLAYADTPSDKLATKLARVRRDDIASIGVLTAAKDRLRWLSRKLYRESKDHEGVNARRADTLFGHYTDDELANAFYLSESPEHLRAGRHRILWLLKEIAEA